jgi:hypothetical protein
MLKALHDRSRVCAKVVKRVCRLSIPLFSDMSQSSSSSMLFWKSLCTPSHYETTLSECIQVAFRLLIESLSTCLLVMSLRYRYVLRASMTAPKTEYNTCVNDNSSNSTTAQSSVQLFVLLPQTAFMTLLNIWLNRQCNSITRFCVLAAILDLNILGIRCNCPHMKGAGLSLRTIPEREIQVLHKATLMVWRELSDTYSGKKCQRCCEAWRPATLLFIVNLRERCISLFSTRFGIFWADA